MPEKEQGPEAPPLHTASEQPPTQQEINDMENFEIFSKFSKKKLTNNILMSIISISMQKDMCKKNDSKSAIPIGGNRDYDKEHDWVWQI